MNTSVLPPKTLPAVPAARLKIPDEQPATSPTDTTPPAAPPKPASSLFATAVSKVAPKLRAAEAALAALESEFPNLAFAEATGEPGAAEALADHRSRAAAQREIVQTLRAAHAAAQEYDSKRERAALASLHKMQMHSVSQHLAARDKAAMDLTAALTNAATALKQIYDRSAKAAAANPSGSDWPAQALCSPHEIGRLVAHEIYRVTNEGSPTGRCRFPGGATSVRDIEQPWAITPLVDVLKGATKGALDILYGRTPA